MTGQQPPEELSRDDLAERVEQQAEAIAALRAEVEALDARLDAVTRQLELVRLTIAGGDEAFWDLPRGGEGQNLVGRLAQYEATLDGFAERLQSLNGSETE